MIMVDASALTAALVDDGPVGDRARSALGADDHWAAPAHLVVEVVAAVRGLLLGGRIGSVRADAAIAALGELVIDTLGLDSVVGQMWAMRATSTPYDAAYIVWAVELGCPLVTCDRRLARAHASSCEIRLV